MTATRKILRTPATIHRVDGQWSQVELCDAEVPLSAFELADKPEEGETPGYADKMIFVRGYKYELTDELAEALADVKVTIRVSTDGRRVVSWVGRHIIEEELPPERQERVVSPASPTFTPAQLAHIDALMAERMAELGLQEAKA